MSEIDNHITKLFRKYLKGDISRIDEQVLDKKVQEDSYVRDAKDGLEQLSKVNARESISNLDARLAARLQKDNSKGSIGWLSMAAGIVILITGALLVWQSSGNKSSVAETSPTGYKSTLDNKAIERAELDISNVDFDVEVYNQGTVSNESLETEESGENKTPPAKRKQQSNTERNLNNPNDLAQSSPTNSSLSDNQEKSSTYYIDGVGVEGDLIPKDEVVIRSQGYTNGRLNEIENVKEIVASEKDANESIATLPKTKSESNDAIAMESTADAQVKREANTDLEQFDIGSENKSKMQRKEDMSNTTLDLKTITGLVREANGKSLIGAKVAVLNSTIGAVTGVDGTFSIDVPKDVNELVIQYTGFQKSIVNVPQNNQVIASLEQGEVLSDAIVTEFDSTFDQSSKSETSAPIGENAAFKKYVKTNLVYPSVANEAGIKGKVILLFNVDASGNPIDVEVKKSLGYGCDEEAIRLLKEGPKWTQPTISEKNSISVRFK